MLLTEGYNTLLQLPQSTTKATIVSQSETGEGPWARSERPYQSMALFRPMFGSPSERRSTTEADGARTEDMGDGSVFCTKKKQKLCLTNILPKLRFILSDGQSIY